MQFEIGQKVVCMNSSYWNYCAFPLVKSNIYTVAGFYTCKCGSRQLYLREIPYKVQMGCNCYRTSIRRHSYYIERFRPLFHYHLYKDVFEHSEKIGEKVEILRFDFVNIEFKLMQLNQ